ncbi:uncharacterized protein LOC108599320 [Drosophila busckii]|uniref:uncharacterized protein LOC108599320 n=1 Tax=Drosophila busckii TaxID=30019 RepID=UPI00083EC028|nr:uncharacterized protein LOC108599320 [Drosophila busckii]
MAYSKQHGIMLLKLLLVTLLLCCLLGVEAKPQWLAVAPANYATPGGGVWLSGTAATAAYYPAYAAYTYTPVYGAYATYPYYTYLRR